MKTHNISIPELHYTPNVAIKIKLFLHTPFFPKVTYHKWLQSNMIQFDAKPDYKSLKTTNKTYCSVESQCFTE